MSEPVTISALLGALGDEPIERQLEVLARGGPLETVLLGLIDEAARLTGADAARADDATAAVMDLADGADFGIARVRARRARARALCYAGRFEQALDLCFEALEIAGAANLPVEAGRIRLASMHALGELGRFDEAIAVGQNARELFVGAGELALAARADINLGVIHQRHEQPAAALTCFARARPLLLDDPVIVGHLDNNRGETLVALNDFSAAEEAYLSALEAMESTDNRLAASIVESNLAELASRQGRLERSLYFFESARRQLESDDSPAVLARLLAEQAETKLVLGLPTEALRDYETALRELDRRGLAVEAARARGGMGQALARLGRRAAAETALAAAATAFGELGHAVARAKIDLIRAELAVADGRHHDAARRAAAALAVLDRRPADAAAARHVLARAALARGDLVTAAADLAAALAAARTLDLAPLLADLLDTRGRLQLKRGLIDDAIDDLEAAVAQVERVRGSLQADRFRVAYLGGRTGTHEALVAAHLDRGATSAVADAFLTAEQAKSRSLLDDVHHGAATSSALSHAEAGTGADDDAGADRERAGAALRHERARLLGELNGLYSRLADEEDTPDGRWTDALHAREHDIDAIDGRLATLDEPNALLARPRPLADVQQGLGQAEVLVEYFSTGDTLTAFVVDRDRGVAVRGIASMTEVAAQLDRTRFQMNRALRPGADRGSRGERRCDDARRELAALDDMLLAPLRRHAEGAKRITIVPHGVLHLVPFPALWDGETYLLERADVRYAPSASLAAHLDDHPAPTNGAVHPVVVGVTDAHAPRTKAEVDYVTDLLGADRVHRLTGHEATVNQVVDALRTASLVHFAGHGRFLSDTPRGSGLRLADRWLTVRDICDLRLVARLVTLSGCETGRSRVDAGDELIGLQRSFFAAGARAIIASLWRVDDDVAFALMRRLYGTLASNPDADLAATLRAAQLEVMSERPHPAHWAPFILVGRP